MQKRRQIIEKHLRVHYPNLRRGDSLFGEFDSHDFLAIGHRNYARLIRELTAMQNQIYDGTKFERLVSYRCANLFFLVLPNELFGAAEIPIDWGALMESNGTLTLARKPIWQDTPPKDRMRFLHRIAMAGTRQLNKKLGITFEEVLTSRRKAVV